MANLPVAVIVAMSVVQVDSTDRRVAKWREPPASQVEYEQQIDDQRNGWQAEADFGHQFADMQEREESKTR